MIRADVSIEERIDHAVRPFGLQYDGTNGSNVLVFSSKDRHALQDASMTPDRVRQILEEDGVGAEVRDLAVKVVG